MLLNVLFPLASYFLGAVPFGLIISKMVGIDVRLEGSRNIGATNVSRVLGKKLGLLTLVCDGLKGYLPMLAAAHFLPEESAKELLVCLCGITAVLGHMFSVYLGFKGGKGVATSLGVFLYLSPQAIGISLIIFVAAVAVTGFVSVGSLLAAGLIPLWLWIFGATPTVIGTAAAVALLIWVKHRENIVRLWQGKEKAGKRRTETDQEGGSEGGGGCYLPAAPFFRSATTWEYTSQYSLMSCLRSSGWSWKYIGLSMSICIASLGVISISFLSVVNALSFFIGTSADNLIQNSKSLHRKITFF